LFGSDIVVNEVRDVAPSLSVSMWAPRSLDTAKSNDIPVFYAKGNEVYYEQLRDFLSSEPTVAEKIKVEPKEDRQVTGNFEVTIGRDVLHSKKKGMGRTETQEERDAILGKIRELLIADE
jgi:hypothetical protein